MASTRPASLASPLASSVAWCKIAGCTQAASTNRNWCWTHLCSYSGGCSSPALSCIPSEEFERYFTCLQHRCQIDGCGYPALSTNVWCVKHSCLVPGCTTIRHPFSDWCEGHTCRIVRDKVTGAFVLSNDPDDSSGEPCSESLDCEKHRCAVLRCGSVRNEDSKYCEDHCCTVEGCFKRRNIGTNSNPDFSYVEFCSEHECSWMVSETGRKCVNSRDDCLRHGCLKCGRTSKLRREPWLLSKVLHNPECKECEGRCEVSGCPQSSFILEWCQNHFCPICHDVLHSKCNEHTMTELIPAMNRLVIDCIESRK